MSKLTAEDLKDLGIAAVEHRRKLLEAIAVQRSPAEPASGPSAQPAAQNEEDRSAAAASAAHRRQLTVMFCDLVGSTALAGQLDP